METSVDVDHVASEDSCEIPLTPNVKASNVPPFVDVFYPQNIMENTMYIVVHDPPGLTFPHRLLIAISMRELNPGDPLTFTVSAKMRWMAPARIITYQCWNLSHRTTPRLPTDLQHELCSHLDIPSLVAMQRTCRSWSRLVTDLLLKERLRIVQTFFPNGDAFLRILADAHAVVGGRAALSFITRDASILQGELDVFVGKHFGDFLDFIFGDGSQLGMTRTSTATGVVEGVDRQVTFMTFGGRTVKLHVSATNSPLGAIAQGSTMSAFINYVSWSTFGCVYPSLTFSRRALAPRKEDLEDIHVQIIEEMESAHGFEFGMQPQCFEIFPAGTEPNLDKPQYPCARHQFMCPHQGRYFGDAGSFVSVFDPIVTSRQLLRRRHSLPYGLSFVWRSPTSFAICDGPCIYWDPLLPSHTRAETFVVVLGPPVFQPEQC
ncbi:hypothetical protein C8Q79DRAFT_916110 [Trametes meyenii]|nr:hypothetical protein C8Q79DRAFT_916110 [Trametes meyenii]